MLETSFGITNMFILKDTWQKYDFLELKIEVCEDEYEKSKLITFEAGRNGYEMFRRRSEKGNQKWFTLHSTEEKDFTSTQSLEKSLSRRTIS